MQILTSKINEAFKGIFLDPNGEWTEVDGRDLEGEADVRQIKNWPANHSIDDLKKICKDSGYSGFTLGKDGTWAAN